MADILSDLFPIPVEFVDNQQPTARFLNAWANQIDTAFAVLARLIGDFDGESSDRPTYITNLVRAIGNMGWLNSRLPRGITQNGAITPTLVETLIAFNGTKEGLLTFQPKALTGIQLDTDDDDVYDNWTRVGAGTPTNPSLNLVSADLWTCHGKRFLSTTLIPAIAKIKYEIDTDGVQPFAFDYYDAYGPDSGANVVPSVHEIAAAGVLCEIGAGNWLQMPKIMRCMNPLLPFSETLEVDFNSTSIHWFSPETTPGYVVPPYLFDLATDADDTIPEGLAALWVLTGEGIHRVVNQNSEDQIQFKIDPANRTKIQIVPPDGFVLPHEEDAALADKYILAFAGVSVAEALNHARARQIAHRHDGLGDDSLVRASSIAERFNPASYTHSPVPYNHFPQYLLRSGYDADSEPLNSDNSMLGDIHLPFSAIVWGDYETGPTLSIDIGDTSTGYDSEGAEGKLVTGRWSHRLPKTIFLGATGSGGWIHANDGYFRFGAENDGVGPSIVEAGYLGAKSGELHFLTYGAGNHLLFSDSDDIYRFLLHSIVQDSVLRLGQVQTVGVRKILQETGEFGIEDGEGPPILLSIPSSKMQPIGSIVDFDGNARYAYSHVGGLDTAAIGLFGRQEGGDLKVFLPLDLPDSVSAANLETIDYLTLSSPRLACINEDDTEGTVYVELTQVSKIDPTDVTKIWTSNSLVLPQEEVSPSIRDLDNLVVPQGEMPIVLNFTGYYYYFKIYIENNIGLLSFLVNLHRDYIG